MPNNYQHFQTGRKAAFSRRRPQGHRGWIGRVPWLGVVSIHHIDPAFFFGFETTGDKNVWMAVPEKALLDIFYLGPARNR